MHAPVVLSPVEQRDDIVSCCVFVYMYIYRYTMSGKTIEVIIQSFWGMSLTASKLHKYIHIVMNTYEYKWKVQRLPTSNRLATRESSAYLATSKSR
jgi:hypothetical protein